MKELYKTCGIVAEYNPFHNGHAYQAAKARELSQADVIIAVMSGNFVQRGEPAVIDKWKRSECAVKNGVDVVIELPYVFSTQAASKFAQGAVDVLKLAGVDSICFGSECGNLENLKEIADTPVNPDHLRASLAEGMSYPKAYSLLAGEMGPNDILGVSYLKAIKDTDIKPYIVQRTNDYLDPTLSTDASAFAIRTAMRQKESFHGSTPMEEILNTCNPVWIQDFYPYFRTFILTSSSQCLSALFLFNEGIENLMKKAAEEHADYEGFLDACVNYRYTAGRIKRSMIQAMMQCTKEEVKALPAPDTFRVLAFNDAGKDWLHSLRNKEIKAASKFSMMQKEYRDMEYRSTLLYTSVLKEEERKRLLKEEISGAHYVQ